MLPEVAHGRRHADIGIVEDASARPGHHRAGPHAASGKRHVGGDNHISFYRSLGDPVVGRIETRRDDDIVYHRIARRPEAGIGDEGHFEPVPRSEEHTSELQSLMRISYAVFCLKKKKQKISKNYT